MTEHVSRLIRDVALPTAGDDFSFQTVLATLMADEVKNAVNDGIALNYAMALYQQPVISRVLLHGVLAKHRVLVDNRHTNARTAVLFAQAAAPSPGNFDLYAVLPLRAFGYDVGGAPNYNEVVMREHNLRVEARDILQAEQRRGNKYATKLRSLMIQMWIMVLLDRLEDLTFDEEKVLRYQPDPAMISARARQRSLWTVGLNALRHADELVGRQNG